ncbi:hypothetical protein H920_04676 [Fukomys damarensis]|uniref:Uncharacterized protein n=1 Tax=Fukomys damarensis TaxID=885580 RepID=A0A091EEV2_FUKDA|nr:hypothetical protein H920_04676 [Fukomys damarensis]
MRNVPGEGRYVLTSVPGESAAAHVLGLVACDLGMVACAHRESLPRILEQRNQSPFSDRLALLEGHNQPLLLSVPPGRDSILVEDKVGDRQRSLPRPGSPLSSPALLWKEEANLHCTYHLSGSWKPCLLGKYLTLDTKSEV